MMSTCESVFEVARLHRGFEPWGKRIVLVCYLDDSDTELGRNLALAGYYAQAESWLRFEDEVAPIFAAYGVDVLRGKDIVDGKGSFKGWRLNKKIEFTDAVFSVLSEHVVEGVASCVEKKWFKRERESRPEFKNVSPLGLALSSTIASITFKAPIPVVDPMKDGIRLFIESGHRNNGNLDRIFAGLMKDTSLIPPNSSIMMIDKRSCRAIQVADMLAFFSRKEMNRINPRVLPRRALFDEPIMKAMAQAIHYRFNHLWDKPDNWSLDIANVTDEELDLSGLTILPRKL